MRIGLFGGSFDPIHIGHVISINEVMIELNLDEIIVMPTKQSPHKSRANSSEFDRFKMVEHAFMNFDNISVHDYEITQSSVSYTYDTIKYLKKQYANDELYLIIGSDQYENFSEWYHYDKILNEVNVAVMRRQKNTSVIEPPFIPMHNKIFEISSTQIRHRIQNNIPVKHLLHEKVYRYIKENFLYE